VLTAGGNPLLADAGTVSYEDAMLKAETEYRKWQQNTFSLLKRLIWSQS